MVMVSNFLSFGTRRAGKSLEFNSSFDYAFLLSLSYFNAAQSHITLFALLGLPFPKGVRLI